MALETSSGLKSSDLDFSSECRILETTALSAGNEFDCKAETCPIDLLRAFLIWVRLTMPVCDTSALLKMVLTNALVWA